MPFHTRNVTDPMRSESHTLSASLPAPDTNNRIIQQTSFDWIQTFWKDPTFEALQFCKQYSYLTRVPWFVDASHPKNAHLSMVVAGLRYILSSTSGTPARVACPQ
jgi:hypothetical protein